MLGERRAALHELTLPRSTRPPPAGPDGCPEIDEFAGAELAVLTGQGSRAGEQMVRDAVTVRHRHPELWARLRKGEVRVWVARKVGRRCAEARLSQAQAQWVDAETTEYVASLPTARFFDLVDAKIIEVDPVAAEQRDLDRARQRFLHAGPRDEHGLRTLVARAHAGDVTYVVAVLDRLAVVLAEQGDTGSADERRAKALRILANPARALALLLRAPECPDGDLGDDVYPGGEGGWMVDAGGRPLPGLPAGRSEPPAGGEGEEGLDPTLPALVLEALERFDASVLDPVTVVHVHISADTLERRLGTVRVEELGPWTARQLRQWLSHPESPEQIQSRITVRAVLDSQAVVAVDRYEIPHAMADLVGVRQPFEVFPYGIAAARRSDKDHVVPYRNGAR